MKMKEKIRELTEDKLQEFVYWVYQMGINDNKEGLEASYGKTTSFFGGAWLEKDAENVKREIDIYFNNNGIVKEESEKNKEKQNMESMNIHNSTEIAYKNGFQAGLKEGLAKGYADGYKTGYNTALLECRKTIEELLTIHL